MQPTRFWSQRHVVTIQSCHLYFVTTQYFVVLRSYGSGPLKLKQDLANLQENIGVDSTHN